MDSPAKPPHPWLTPTIAIVAFIFSCILWPYLQMRHWAQPSIDYLEVSETIVATLASAALLGWATVKNYRDASRAKKLTAEMALLKESYEGKLKKANDQIELIAQAERPANQIGNIGSAVPGRKLESAFFWGSMGKEDVAAKLLTLSDDQELAVNQYELCAGKDPSYGRPKFLTVTYSETLKEGDIFVSPSGWLRGSSNAYTENAPQLLITYKADGPKNILTLYNDSSETLYSWNLRPLKIVDRKHLSTVYGNPSIEPKHHLITEIVVGDVGEPLFDYMRGRRPYNAEVTAEVYYEDRMANKFIRPFTLTTYPNGDLLWQPGPVRRA